MWKERNFRDREKMNVRHLKNYRKMMNALLYLRKFLYVKEVGLVFEKVNINTVRFLTDRW